MKYLFFILVFLSSSMSRAVVADLGTSFLFEPSLGYSQSTFKNDVGTGNVIYEGTLIKLNFGYVLFEGDNMEFTINASGRYLFAENTKELSSLTDEYKMSGLGVGFNWRFTSFGFGANYYQNNMKFESRGSINATNSLNANTYSAFIQYFHRFVRSDLGVGIDYELGKVPAEESGLSYDQDYEALNLSVFITLYF